MTPYPSATTPTAAAAGVPSPYPDAHPGARLFRGRSLEALLPLIREALGPDAIVLRRREGLEGGTLGFFQTRFVEVEAIAGEPTALSVLDDGPAWPDDVADDGVRWLDEPAPQAFAAGMLPPAAGAPTASAPVTAAPTAAAAAPFAAAPTAGPAAPVASAPQGHVAQAASPALWPAATDGFAPIDGEAFLRHLDAAVERRRTQEGTVDPSAQDPAGTTVEGAAGSVAPAVRAADDADRLLVAGASPALGDAPIDEGPRRVAPWSPARAYARTGAAVPAVAAGPAAAPATPARTITAPGSGEVALVAGPARGRLELRDDVPAGPPAIAATRTSGDGAAPDAGPDRAPRTTRPARGFATGDVATPGRRGVDADVAEYGLIARGLSPALARSVVGEAAAHGRPLDPGHRMDRATRAALARRIPRPEPRGDVRTMVVVGAPGAGRTSAVGALAAAHAGAGRRVLAVAMGARDGGAALAAAVVGTDVELLVAGSGATAAAAIRAADPDVCVVDTPAAGPSDVAAVAALAAELRDLGADEVLVAVPGTHATGQVHDVLDGLAPLGADGLLLTHRDRAERPGGIVGASIVRGVPIAYVTDGDAIALADVARLARMVQP